MNAKASQITTIGLLGQYIVEANNKFNIKDRL